MKRIFKAVSQRWIYALATSAMAGGTFRPIKLMIAFAAGGGADTQARKSQKSLKTNRLEIHPEQGQAEAA